MDYRWADKSAEA